MTAFEPGEGWREVSGTAEEPDLVEYDDGLPVRLWVRQQPVPALPTEPGYYVAQTPTYGGPVVVELLNRPVGQWVDAGDRNYLDAQDVARLGALERLEKRAETAKVVLEFLTNATTPGHVDAHSLFAARTEFGVES